MARVRLDTLLVTRGLAASPERARARVLAGQVQVDGVTAAKAGHLIDERASLSLAVPDHPYVSRGGVKLAHALDAFAIPVRGRLALDIGASTGGFTDVLLKAGASRVVAYNDEMRKTRRWLRDIAVTPKGGVREVADPKSPTRNDLAGWVILAWLGPDPHPFTHPPDTPAHPVIPLK